MTFAASAGGKAAALRRQGGVTLIGLLFWAVLISCLALVAVKVLPTLNEYFTIQRTVNQIAASGGSTVQELRSAFERQKDIEYSITAIGGEDLEITKENERVVIRFGYDKEIELVEPVYLVIKYRGQSQ